MRGVVMRAPGDVRVEDRENPTIIEPTDAIIRLAASCICGSDLWPYRGAETGGSQPDGPRVRRRRDRDRRRREERARSATSSSARSSPPTTPARSAGPATSPAACTPPGLRRHAGRVRPHPPRRRHPGRHPGPARRRPDPSLLAASDVLGTGWFAAVAAEAGPGKTVAVVGDGAVGLLGILAARRAGRRADHRDEPPRRPSGPRPGVRRDRHRRGTRRRGRGEDQGAHRRARRAQRHRSRRHPGVDDAGHPRHARRRSRRLRRRLPRRVARWPRTVLLRRAPARRPRPGAPLPARAHPADLGSQDRPRRGLRPHAPPRGGRRGLPAMDERRATKVLLTV